MLNHLKTQISIDLKQRLSNSIYKVVFMGSHILAAGRVSNNLKSVSD